MTFEYERTVTTTASPDDVWALWSDIGSWHAWDPAVERVALEGHFAEGAAGDAVARRRRGGAVRPRDRRARARASSTGSPSATS